MLTTTIFFTRKVRMARLRRTRRLLQPLVKPTTNVVFTVTLLFTNFTSSTATNVTKTDVFTKVFNRSCSVGSFRAQLNLTLACIPTLLLVIFVASSFRTLLFSRVFLDLRLPVAVFLRLCVADDHGIVKRCTGHGFAGVLL